jgi:hypothetical protein
MGSGSLGIAGECIAARPHFIRPARRQARRVSSTPHTATARPAVWPTSTGSESFGPLIWEPGETVVGVGLAWLLRWPSTLIRTTRISADGSPPRLLGYCRTPWPLKLANIPGTIPA